MVVKIIQMLTFYDGGHSVWDYHWDDFPAEVQLSYLSQLLIAMGSELKIPNECYIVFRVGNWNPQGGPTAILHRLSDKAPIWSFRLCCTMLDEPEYVYSEPWYGDDSPASIIPAHTYEYCDPALVDHLEQDLELASALKLDMLGVLKMKVRRVFSLWFRLVAWVKEF